jgi:hypothetical protein
MKITYTPPRFSKQRNRTGYNQEAGEMRGSQSSQSRHSGKNKGEISSKQGKIPQTLLAFGFRHPNSLLNEGILAK